MATPTSRHLGLLDEAFYAVHPIEKRNTKGTDVSKALLVIDVQIDVVAGNWHRDEKVANIAALVAAAREKRIPVVWIRHSSPVLELGSPGWEIVPELQPAVGEPIVEKRYGDSFEDTDLKQVLDELKATELFLCGANTIACVISTCYGAFVRGYNTTLIGDAHLAGDGEQPPYSIPELGFPTPEQAINLVNGIWSRRSAPGREAKVITTPEFCA